MANKEECVYKLLVQCKENSSVNKDKPNVMPHLLYCSINKNAPLDEIQFDVSGYFYSNAGTNSNTNQREVSFRGRLLTGQEISLPENYSGVVFEASDQPANTYSQSSEFNSVNVWSLKERNDCSSFAKTLEWCEIAETIHNTSDVATT